MKFSILSACSNKKSYIRDCYNSLCSQDFKNWEWVVVDDCSTDGSDGVLKKIARSDNRVKFIRSATRLYCGSAYGQALSESAGSIVGVVDIDDALSRIDAISRIISLYDKYPDICYIYTQHNLCDKQLRELKMGVSSLPSPDKSFAEMAKERKHCYSHWRTFRKSVEKNARLPLFRPGLKACVDKNLGMVLEECGPGGFYNKVLYSYRWYWGNLTTLSPSGSNKGLWRKLASKFRDQRQQNNIPTFPVMEIS